MRRFYERVTVGPAEGDDEGFLVRLDARPVLTPGKRTLVLPGEALAGAVAAEWEGQGDTVEPAAMPLTRLANTALDRVRDRLAEVAAEVAHYAETDLVCYRVAQPPELRARQDEAWDPLVAWAEEVHGARLAVTAGLLPTPQPDEALAAIHRAVEAQGPFALSGLHAATAALGSVVIALAMAAGEVSAAEATRVSMIEEVFQAERWGEDADAKLRRATLGRDVEAAQRFLSLCP